VPLHAQTEARLAEHYEEYPEYDEANEQQLEDSSEICSDLLDAVPPPEWNRLNQPTLPESANAEADKGAIDCLPLGGKVSNSFFAAQALGRTQPKSMDLKAEAETLRCGLLAGCATVAEAVDWADALITATPAPDIAVIKVSLAGSRAPVEVAALLEEVPGEADGIQVRRQLMDRMRQLLDEDPSRGDEIARWLYRLASSGELRDELFGWEPYGLDDTFELARNRVYGTHTEAVAQLRAYLERHAAASAPE